MCQPKVFKVPSQEDKVIHLKQVSYGLKSGCEWYEDLMATLMNVGFQRCKVKHTMFYQFDQDTNRCGQHHHHQQLTQSYQMIQE